MGSLCGHLVYILVCVSIVSNQIEKGTIMALSGVRTSDAKKGFQRLWYDTQPLEGKKKLSPIVFRGNGGKGENATIHDVGLTLSTVFDHDRFIHSVTVTDQRLIDSFRKADIPTTGRAQMTALYDLDIGSLDHEDVLQYIDMLYNNRRGSTGGNKLQLSLLFLMEPNVFRSPSVAVNISISPLNGFRLLCKVVTINTRRVIVTEKLDDGRMYRDERCVIASAVGQDDYITALPDGRLGLRPLSNGHGGSARGAVFVLRQYLGFTSEVHDPYRVFRDGSAVHVHMFHIPERAQKKDSNDFFQGGGAAGYISRGFFQAGAGNNTISKRSGFQGEEEEGVFINTRSRAINSYVLREEDPRFFYEMKISGTDLSVFMSTSKPNHYLAVSGNKATLSLQQVPNVKDFLRGYDEAKFRVFDIGKQFNFTSQFLGKL